MISLIKCNGCLKVIGVRLSDTHFGITFCLGCWGK